MKLFRRDWPVVIPLYDARQCPECCALVSGKAPRRIHEQWHRELDELFSDGEQEREPDGYVIGNGPLPASVRGGGDE